MAMFPHGIWKKSRLMECSAGAREVFMLVYGMLDPWGVMVYSRRAIVASWCKDDDTQPPMNDGQLKEALEELKDKGMIDFYEEDDVRYIASRWHENEPSKRTRTPLPPWITAERYTVGKNKQPRWRRILDVDAWERWRADRDKPQQPPQPQQREGEETPCRDWELTEDEAARFLHERSPEIYTDGWFTERPKSASHMAQAFLDDCRRQGRRLTKASWQEELLRYEEEQHRLMKGM